MLREQLQEAFYAIFTILDISRYNFREKSTFKTNVIAAILWVLCFFV